MRNVVALYDRIEDAQRAVQALKDAGFDHREISMIAADRNNEYSRQLKGRSVDQTDESQAGKGAAAGAGTGAVIGAIGGLLLGLGALAIPGIGPIIAAGPIASALAGAGIGAAAGGILGALVGLGIPEEEAHVYAEGVRRGGTLVVARTQDEHADRASSILNQFNPVDIDQRVTDWRKNNWTRFDERAEPLHEEMTNIPITGGHDTTIPVIEEDLHVDKREVESGGVHLRAHVEEEPVTRDVHLREEHINVERRPVNRPATDQDRFIEGEMDLKETREEPVVRKEARVVEEVHINKDVEEHDETISETLRHQRVDISNINEQEWRSREPRFQQHYQSRFGSQGRGYQHYMPAYQYGFAVGTDPRFANQDWNRVESFVRGEWERAGYDTSWNDAREAIRYGWEEGRRR